MANTTGLGDTIYAAVRKALEDKGSGGGGGGGETYTITVYKLDGDTPVPSESKVYLAEWSQDQMKWSASATEASEAAGGTVICADGDHTIATVVSSLDMASTIAYPIDAMGSCFTMPAHAVYVVVIDK